MSADERARYMAALQRYESLSRAAEATRMDIVAQHYLRNACNARDLLELLKLGRKVTPLDANATACAKMLFNRICDTHARDLGISLQWHAPVTLCRPEQPLSRHETAFSQPNLDALAEQHSEARVSRHIEDFRNRSIHE